MANKKLNPETEKAVSAIRERLVLTLQFMQDAQEFPSGKQWLDLVEEAASRGELRTLRLLAKEVDAMTSALASHERDGLEALLLSRLGVNKEAERGDLQRQVAKVLNRGTIASEKERRRLEEYAEMLEVTGGEPAEIESVRQLLRSG